MSFDEEGDHYMSKADFAMMCDELKKAVAQRDELLAALKALVDCISETRGPDANKALFYARELISKSSQ